MSGIFLSYSRADRTLAERIVRRLRGLGVEVWWDQDMPGVDWQDELQQRAKELSGVLVVWTPNSFASRHVKDEARLAREGDKLINVVAGVPQPPFPYDAVNALPLDGWTGREPHGGWTRTVKTVEALLVAAGAAKPGAISAALAEREAEISRQTRAVADAQSALQEAQSCEADAAEAAVRASADCDKADAEVRSVVGQGLGLRVVDAARQELDVARQRETEADAALRGAKAQLSEAARALGKANADLEAVIDERQTEAEAPKPEPVEVEPPQAVAPPLPEPPVAEPPALRPVVQAAPAAEVVPPPPTTVPTPEPLSAKVPLWRQRRAWIGAPIAALVIAAGVWAMLPRIYGTFAEDAYEFKNYDASLYWAKLAAARGNTDGFILLADLYGEGHAVKQDWSQAFYWQQKAAEAGDMVAMLVLAECYQAGTDGAPQDETQARYWYQKLADRGDPEAKDWLTAHPE